MIRRRHLLRVGMGAAAVAAAGARAVRPLRLVVAYPTGGVSDSIARVLARAFTDTGAPVIVENRPGAGGSVALASLARAPADGRTLAFCAISPLTLSPHFGLHPPAVRPISGVMRTPQLLVATPALGDIGWSGMLARARAENGKLRWATSGVGTLGHLILEQVCATAKISVVHVPYAGGGSQILDAVAGRIELLSTNLAPAQLELLAARRLFALALGARDRAAPLPELPTLAELGFPQASRASLFGVFAAPKTPDALVDELNLALGRAMASATFQSLLATSGNTPWRGSAAMFSEEIEEEAQAVRDMRMPARR